MKLALRILLCLPLSGCMFIGFEKRIDPAIPDDTEILERALSEITLGIDRDAFKARNVYLTNESSPRYVNRHYDSWKQSGVFKEVAYLDELSTSPDLAMKAYDLANFRPFIHPWISFFSLWTLPDGFQETIEVRYSLENRQGESLDISPLSYRRIIVYNLLSFPLVFFPGWKMAPIAQPTDGKLDWFDIQKFLLPDTKILGYSEYGPKSVDEGGRNEREKSRLLNMLAAEQEKVMKLLGSVPGPG